MAKERGGGAPLENRAPFEDGAHPVREELRHLPQAPRLIVEISRLLRGRVRSGFADDIMSQNTARVVLCHLAVAGRLSQRELVELTHLRAPTVSVLLSQMEAEGYVRRECGNDRRQLLVELTDKGRAYDSERMRAIATTDQAAMLGITPEEEAELLRLLRKIRQNLSEQKGEAT